jgi:hypothetical protein
MGQHQGIKDRWHERERSCVHCTNIVAMHGEYTVRRQEKNRKDVKGCCYFLMKALCGPECVNKDGGD